MKTEAEACVQDSTVMYPLVNGTYVYIDESDRTIYVLAVKEGREDVVGTVSIIWAEDGEIINVTAPLAGKRYEGSALWKCVLGFDSMGGYSQTYYISLTDDGDMYVSKRANALGLVWEKDGPYEEFPITHEKKGDHEIL